MSSDEVFKVEKGLIRSQKLNYILNNFNVKYCCPRVLIEELIEEDEYPKYKKKVEKD